MQHRFFAGLSLSLALAASAALLACPASLDDRCTDGACSDAGAALTADGGDAAPHAFDRCIATPLEPSCLDDTHALFVATSRGTSRARGTRAEPVSSIAAALALVTTERKRIYVCAGTYPEDLKLGRAFAEGAIYGGISCAFDGPGDKPRIGLTAHPAEIRGADHVVLSDLELAGRDAVEAGASSVALFVEGSTVTLQRLVLAAGNGAAGSDAGVVPYTYADLDLRGNSATRTALAADKQVVCPDGAITVGGGGGGLQQDGATGKPRDDMHRNGSRYSECVLAPDVVTGVPGLPGEFGADGAGGDGFGTLDAVGWHSRDGQPGHAGGPGQGGGGGAGGESFGFGAGGGAGGCGGAGGGPGGGGGASIALLCLDCSVTLRGCFLSTQQGGSGGNGTSGLPGQPSGGAAGSRTGSGCNAGSGGYGGPGGASGGGSGGVSAAIVYRSTERPLLDESSSTRVGQPGSPGLGPKNPGTRGATGGLLPVP